MMEKDTARGCWFTMPLKTIDYGDTEMVVRINPLNTPYGKKDIEAVVKASVACGPDAEDRDRRRGARVEAEIEK